jgi:glycosyltransferase involved in cell wall biosynthesis
MKTSIIIVTRENIDIKNYTSGQEFFLYMLMNILSKYGIHVKITDVKELMKNHERYICNSMHLYYLGFKDIIMLKRLYKDAEMIYHVYHVEDVSWTRTHELSWKAFLLSIQPLISTYLVTSKSVYTWLKSRAFLAKSILIEPYYECSCEVFHSNSYIDMVCEKFHDNEIRMLYVGRLNPYRSPPHMLLEIANDVSKKVKKSVRLVIVTTSENLPEATALKYNNLLTVEIINRRVDDKEKCELYRKSQFFIYLTPWGNVAMNPPITILEAVYHGVIPIVSETISKDLKIPNTFIANNVEEATNKIITLSLCNSSEKVLRDILILKKAFEGFYNENRFINAFKCLI